MTHMTCVLWWGRGCTQGLPGHVARPQPPLLAHTQKLCFVVTNEWQQQQDFNVPVLYLIKYILYLFSYKNELKLKGNKP